MRHNHRFPVSLPSMALGTGLLVLANCALHGQTFYSDVAADVGITGFFEKGGYCPSGPDLASGSAWADYDNDGDVDLYVTSEGGVCYLYRNEGDTNGDGLPNFTDQAAATGTDNTDGSAHSAVFVDYDNDGDEDLYITRTIGNVLFRNELVETGAATFVDVTPTAGLQNFGRAVTTAWADFNGDGFLDVYLAKHQYCPPADSSQDFLYKNNGDGTFTDVSGYLCEGGVSPCAKLLGNGFTAGWVDYDNDGDLDLYLANDYITTHRWPNVLWRNDGSDGSGGWVFTDVSAASGSGVAMNAMGLGMGDYDNDGFVDLALSNISATVLLHNNTDGTFTDVADAAGTSRPETPYGDRAVTWGTVFFDYNNDRWLDLFYVAGEIALQIKKQPNAMFENNRDGTFTDISVASGLDDTLRGRSASIVDFDNDGFVDVFLGNIQRNDLGPTTPFRLFHNNMAKLGNTNHWLTVTVEGTVSNRDGIGTRMYVTTPDGIMQIRDITSGPTYGGGDYRAGFFGLDTWTTADLVVRWPTGEIQDLGSVTADQRIHLVEPNSAIPCGDITSFQGRCVGGGTKTLQFRINLLNNTIHAGEEVTFDVDGTNYTATIVSNGTHSRASSQVPGVSTGDHTISLIDPAGCFAPLVVSCAADRQNGEWEATDALFDGTGTNSGTHPSETRLIGNYPNPFNPSTAIRYELAHEMHVTLRVFDLLGQEVVTLVDEPQPAGYREIVWNGHNASGESVPSGVYFYTITAGGFVAVNRMLMIK